MEQVKGIEPSFSAWKADALAIVLHLHKHFLYIVENAKQSIENRDNHESSFLILYIYYITYYMWCQHKKPKKVLFFEVTAMPTYFSTL